MLVFDIETTGLNPFNDGLVTIQIKEGGYVIVWKRWEVSELGMIGGLMELLKHIPRDDPILGYNILKFDLPFIAIRLLLLGKADGRLWSSFYERNWIDLYQLLGDQYRNLDFWLARFNIVRTCEVRGCDIPRLFTLERYDKITLHAMDDIVSCERLYTELKRQHRQETSYL